MSGTGAEGCVAASARLLLRELTFDDAPFIVELLNDPSFLRFIGDRGVRDEADARRYLENGPIGSYARNGFGLYAVVTRDGGEATGICGLLRRDWLEHPDVGFAYLARFRGRGYAVEAAAAVLEDAVQRLGLLRLAAIVSHGNERSVRVLEKIGFRREADARPPGEDADVSLFAWTAPGDGAARTAAISKTRP